VLGLGSWLAHARAESLCRGEMGMTMGAKTWLIRNPIGLE
jgi:hypothetical protein